MAKRVQRVRHDAAAAQAFLGKEGEITVDRSNDSIRVHDGVNPGGTESARADLNNVVDASAATHGKMSAQQAADLVQALLDIITNAADIAILETTLDASKADKIVPSAVGNVATLDAVGNLTDSGKTFASTDDVIDNFPVGTLMLFQQTAAPVGWTKEITHDDKALRIVSGTVVNGGTKAFTTTFGSGKISDSHVLSIAEMPAHTHDIQVYEPGTTGPNTVAAEGDNDGSAPIISGAALTTGGGGGHTHPLTNFDLQYVDIIIASKD